MRVRQTFAFAFVFLSTLSFPAYEPSAVVVHGLAPLGESELKQLMNSESLSAEMKRRYLLVEIEAIESPLRVWIDTESTGLATIAGVTETLNSFSQSVGLSNGSGFLSFRQLSGSQKRWLQGTFSWFPPMSESSLDGAGEVYIRPEMQVKTQSISFDDSGMDYIFKPESKASDVLDATLGLGNTSWNPLPSQSSNLKIGLTMLPYSGWAGENQAQAMSKALEEFATVYQKANDDYKSAYRRLSNSFGQFSRLSQTVSAYNGLRFESIPGDTLSDLSKMMVSNKRYGNGDVNSGLKIVDVKTSLVIGMKIKSVRGVEGIEVVLPSHW